MINKLTLNNEIVAMRKVVRQAKVHVIRKLIREMKKLRERHGPEVGRAKCMRKAERMGEQMALIKKMRPDDVSKFALKMYENPIEMLSSPDISVEQRALYRLAASKVIAERVGQIHQRLPDLKDCIIECLEELGRNKKQHIKAWKKLDPKEDTRKEHLFSGKSHDSNSQSHSMKIPSKEVNTDTVGNKLHLLVKDQKHMESGWIVADMNSDDDEDTRNEVEDAEKFVMGKQKLDKKEPITNKRNGLCESHRSIDKISRGEAEIKKMSDVLEEATHEPVKEKYSRIENEVAPCVDEKGPSLLKETVDPFFVNPDGKTEYLTSAVAEDDKEEVGIQIQEKKKSFAWGKDLRKEFSNPINDSKMRSRIHDSRDSLLIMNKHRHSKRSLCGRISANKSQEKDSGNTRKINTTSVGEEKLHPSWEAKRRQKELSISNIVFQGKKVKFEND